MEKLENEDNFANYPFKKLSGEGEKRKRAVNFSSMWGTGRFFFMVMT